MHKVFYVYSSQKNLSGRVCAEIGRTAAVAGNEVREEAVFEANKNASNRFFGKGKI